MVDKSRPYVIDLRKVDPSTEREKDNNSQSLQRTATGFVVLTIRAMTYTFFNQKFDNGVKEV